MKFVETDTQNWLVEVGKLEPGDTLSFRRTGGLTIDQAAAALKMQYPGRPDLLMDWHGSSSYVIRKDYHEDPR